jgi:hypothetical protein
MSSITLTAEAKAAMIANLELERKSFFLPAAMPLLISFLQSITAKRSCAPCARLNARVYGRVWSDASIASQPRNARCHLPNYLRPPISLQSPQPPKLRLQKQQSPRRMLLPLPLPRPRPRPPHAKHVLQPLPRQSQSQPPQSQCPSRQLHAARSEAVTRCLTRTRRMRLWMSLRSEFALQRKKHLSPSPNQQQLPGPHALLRVRKRLQPQYSLPKITMHGRSRQRALPVRARCTDWSLHLLEFYTLSRQRGMLGVLRSSEEFCGVYIGISFDSC